MTDDCGRMQLLIQADVDGELTPAEAAQVAVHLRSCAGCATLQENLISLSQQMRDDLLAYKAPSDLRNAIRARLADTSAPPQAPPARTWPFRLQVLPFGGGFALAACLALVFLLPRTAGLTDEVVADHIRALQPGHLMDVVSTDQHTVKPWFDGRLNFAPPVKDLKADGFPLTGGRLDYLTNRPVAALIYQHGQHVIDLYIWPDDGRLDSAPTEASRSGYNVQHWSQDGMAFWAVSDLAAAELSQFVKLLRAGG